LCGVFSLRFSCAASQGCKKFTVSVEDFNIFLFLRLALHRQYGGSALRLDGCWLLSCALSLSVAELLGRRR
jgi:hypothetical protein